MELWKVLELNVIGIYRETTRAVIDGRGDARIWRYTG
jgi:hypothetical protein